MRVCGSSIVSLPDETVYDRKDNQYVCSPVGYMVVTNAANPTGYTSAQCTQYSYAPVNAGCYFLKMNDPDVERWVGTTVSVGKASQAVEVMPKAPLDSRKTYQIARPRWGTDETLEQRLVATAVFATGEKKLVLRVTEFSQGCSMADVRPGYDIYEEAPGKESEI